MVMFILELGYTPLTFLAREVTRRTGGELRIPASSLRVVEGSPSCSHHCSNAMGVIMRNLVPFNGTTARTIQRLKDEFRSQLQWRTRLSVQDKHTVFPGEKQPYEPYCGTIVGYSAWNIG